MGVVGQLVVMIAPTEGWCGSVILCAGKGAGALATTATSTMKRPSAMTAARNIHEPRRKRMGVETYAPSSIRISLARGASASSRT